MGIRQEELPNTRREDEPPPFRPIKAMEENIDEWQKALASRKKLNQRINELLLEQQDLLVKHKRDVYPYEAKGGGEREIYRVTAVKSRKTKTKAETETGGKGKRGKKSDEAPTEGEAS